MEIIDRYVHEIGEHLPWNLRADVEQELRSLLEESLEERARAANRPADAELAAQVLREVGAPREVARRYLPQDQYLIGPRLFPAYKLAITIALIVIAAISGALALASIITSALGHGVNLDALTVAKIISRFIVNIFFNVALLTLVFAVMERAQAHRAAAAPAWSPAMLPPVKDPDRISQAAMVIGMYLILAFAVLFNFYPEWVGFAVVDGRVTLRGLLRPEFATYMPLINLFWALDFTLSLVVLRHGRWRRETRWAEFALGIYAAAILCLLIAGEPVFRYERAVKGGLKGWLLLVLLSSGLRLYRLLTRHPFEPWRYAEAATPPK
jgi:hypothetical protein